MFDPQLTYFRTTMRDLRIEVTGHQVGRLAIREITVPFVKVGADGAKQRVDHGFMLELWEIDVGILSCERFETALFIADSLSIAMPEEGFADEAAAYRFMGTIHGWLAGTVACGDAGEKMHRVGMHPGLARAADQLPTAFKVGDSACIIKTPVEEARFYGLCGTVSGPAKSVRGVTIIPLRIQRGVTLDVPADCLKLLAARASA